MAKIPPSRVCPLCGHQDHLDPALSLPDDTWLFTCRGPHEPTPYDFLVAEDKKVVGYPEGFAAELGLYDVLPDLLVDDEPFVEYGVVEYRYALAHPDGYRQVVDRYGHTRYGPKKYTASAFLAGTLGRMARAADVFYADGPATGYWKFNGRISHWANRPDADSATPLSWAGFAEAQGFDPEDWPPLGYVAADG